MAQEPEHKPPRAPLGGVLAWWPFLTALLGVVVVVVVVVLVGALGGGGTTGSRQQGTGLTASGAVACPEFFENVPPKGTSVLPWVPAKPAGVHSKQKLVPTLHPTHVTICRYGDGSGTKSQPLSGQRVLTGDLDRVATTLRPSPKAAERSCTGDRPAGAYLIGLRYAEAIVWVSAPTDACLGSGNGAFHTDRNLSIYAAAAYAARTWVGSPD